MSNIIDEIKRENYNAENQKVLKKLSSIYTPDELKQIAMGGYFARAHKPKIIDFSGMSVRFAAIGDTHAGSIWFDNGWYASAVTEIKKQKCEFVFHVGDISEGMSSRDGHVLELTHIGYSAQKNYCLEILTELNLPIYAIDGNHDRWALKKNGADIGNDLQKELTKFTFLGHDNGRVKIKNCIIELYHGEDGSSYAISYRVQKIIEAYSGGLKPNILLCGHSHKMSFNVLRNIHAFQCGALSKQSNYMRSKRLENHAGFWIIDLTLNKSGGVNSVGSKWYPFYEK